MPTPFTFLSLSPSLRVSLSRQIRVSGFSRGGDSDGGIAVLTGFWGGRIVRRLFEAEAQNFPDL